MWIVYEHKNKINGKRYFGITSKTLNIRCGKNGERYWHNEHLQSAIKKYGWENFEHNIILKDITKEEACYAEIYLIKWYDTTNPEKGYNQSTGGDISALGSHSPNKHKGEPRSDETKRRISEARKGHPGYSKGKHLTEEQRQKIKEKRKGQATTKGKKVKQKSTGKIYNSLREAEKETGINRRYISKQIKKYNNPDWEYIEKGMKPE